MPIHTAIELNNIAADVLDCGTTVGDARNICRASVLHLRTSELTNQRTTVSQVPSAGQSFHGQDAIHADILQARMELEESRRMCAISFTSMYSNQQMQTVSQPPSSSSFQPTNPENVAATTTTTTTTSILDLQTLRSLYNRPIRIHFDGDEDSSSTIPSTTALVDEAEQISGIILYNFALSHQKLGIRDQDAVHINKASALYEMALKLLMPDVARQMRELNESEDTDNEPALENHRQGPILENLTLLSAAACLYNSMQISTLLDDDNTDLVNLLDALHKICILKSKKRASRRGDSPENIDIDAEEAWNLFFFSALNLPLSGISRAA